MQQWFKSVWEIMAMFQLNNAIDHETNPNKALCFKIDLKCEFTFEQSLLICLFYYLMSCLKISQNSYSLRHRVTNNVKQKSQIWNVVCVIGIHKKGFGWELKFSTSDGFTYWYLLIWFEQTLRASVWSRFFSVQRWTTSTLSF